METAASDEDGAAQTEAASAGSEADADRKRKRAEVAKASRAAKAVADGRLPGQRGRPRTVAGSTAAAAQLMPPPPPLLLPMGTVEAQAYIDDARCRLRELQSALVADSSVHVTFAGQGGSIALGTGLAVDQWRAAFDARVGDAARLLLVAELECGVELLRDQFPSRVHIGRVSGADASATQIMVWGANASNADLQNGTRIQGSGQAAAMGVQKPGVFGIITTPLCGPPPQGISPQPPLARLLPKPVPPPQPQITSDDVRAARETAQAAAARAAQAAQAAQTTEDWASAAFLLREAAAAAEAAGKVAQAPPEGVQLHMSTSTAVEVASELQLGEGEWDQVGSQHWVSEVVQGIKGDGRLHLWPDADSGSWYVTSSEAWAANREYPAFGTNGEYPHMTSDFQGTSPWAGTFDDGRVRFEVLDSD